MVSSVLAKCEKRPDDKGETTKHTQRIWKIKLENITALLWKDNPITANNGSAISDKSKFCDWRFTTAKFYYEAATSKPLSMYIT